ncbi:bifunctional diaminohydroxyphosphoribosylaminopyrimidine deaminase/5-amino-6-(5-phosphoribosylamino)uracil reductase RibD [Archangium sp.]|uniref:bifunctional diaminohydroxyphosphoribosylaminopyrimidine deaminase/5-amino-6-(5-phosphoribosylamino)uracil reductase RibD n=1 Tax=Archangium sp. TaxID=1872627 RepID=UPI002D543C10|nr:bifunctional diaminohydroxyphosphoribosylaminopyrimidine deaminase/5-amino-6-(5-phosphoribosylamino)uracil reductase RibD [Archangium sp.]HYO52889.1 bifunctional diaminohydroxyphosphoribosylaminopyrimidine deaminase/5-amino-6-(5-phosphoribosylamino)uracil reductase RibD [Archangium sp.]
MSALRRGFGGGGVIQRTLPTTLQARVEPVLPHEMTDDEHWMQQALERAMSAVGRSHPNPTVGCVIVKDGQLLASGATEVYGSRHAERVAIESVADRSQLRGATLYVTLEPCAHTGRQPPCAELVASCGFARCVVGVLDPNPLVAGKGLRRLRETGMEVRTGVLGSEAIAWHLPFLFWQVARRTLIAARWAQTLDGQLAYDDGRSQWISGPESRAYTHWLRQKYDAILVGAGTVLADHPALTVRSCVEPQHRQPIRFLFDPSARILSCPEADWREILTRTFSPETPTVLMVRESALSAARRERLATLRFEHVHLQLLPEDEAPAASLLAVLADPTLAVRVGRPIHSVMVEGGPRLLSTLAEAGMLDLAHVFTAPTLGGGQRYRLSFPSPHGIGARMYPLAHARLGDDLMLELLYPSTQKLLEELEVGGRASAPMNANEAA